MGHAVRNVSCMADYERWVGGSFRLKNGAKGFAFGFCLRIRLPQSQSRRGVFWLFSNLLFM